MGHLYEGVLLLIFLHNPLTVAITTTAAAGTVEEATTRPYALIGKRIGPVIPGLSVNQFMIITTTIIVINSVRRLSWHRPNYWMRALNLL